MFLIYRPMRLKYKKEGCLQSDYNTLYWTFSIRKIKFSLLYLIMFNLWEIGIFFGMILKTVNSL